MSDYADFNSNGSVALHIIVILVLQVSSYMPT